MGHNRFTRSAYESAVKAAKVANSHVTKKAEKQASDSGKLNPLVDPSGFNTIRPSLPRVDEFTDQGGEKRYRLNVGTPMPIETRIDTTGSMGNNVDIAMRVMPDAFEQWSRFLPGYDIQVATGIFGDTSDKFPLCRPQFEMQPEKILEQLTLMVPLRAGGDIPEDPDIGIFGGAYLVRAYINRIKLKGYDFTVTDAPGRGRIDPSNLIRVYGDSVFKKVGENGHETDFSINNGPIMLTDVWKALLRRAHAFILLVSDDLAVKKFWFNNCGRERVVVLPSTEYLPYIQAVLIGLTEGTLLLTEVSQYLSVTNMSESEKSAVCDSVAGIPICAQAKLPNFARRPQKGDVFAGKPDAWTDANLWPNKDLATPAETKENTEPETEPEKSNWL